MIDVDNLKIKELYENICVVLEKSDVPDKNIIELLGWMALALKPEPDGTRPDIQ